MPVAPTRVSPTRTALTAETAHLPSTVPSSLRGGHPGIHDHPRGLPCNWVDYYEGPRLFMAKLPKGSGCIKPLVAFSLGSRIENL